MKLVAILLVFVHLSLHVQAARKLCIDVDPKGRKWDNPDAGSADNTACKFEVWQDVDGTMRSMGSRLGITWRNNRSWNNCIDLDDQADDHHMTFLTTDCEDAIWIDRFKMKLGSRTREWWGNNRAGACLSMDRDDDSVDTMDDSDDSIVVANYGRCWQMFGLPEWDDDDQYVHRWWSTNNPEDVVRRALGEDGFGQEVDVASFFLNLEEEHGEVPQFSFLADSDDDTTYGRRAMDSMSSVLKQHPKSGRRLLQNQLPRFGDRPKSGRRSLQSQLPRFGDRPKSGRRSLQSQLPRFGDRPKSGRRSLDDKLRGLNFGRDLNGRLRRKLQELLN